MRYVRVKKRETPVTQDSPRKQAPRTMEPVKSTSIGSSMSLIAGNGEKNKSVDQSVSETSEGRHRLYVVLLWIDGKPLAMRRHSIFGVKSRTKMS